jgi:hypothetical protein
VGTTKKHKKGDSETADRFIFQQPTGNVPPRTKAERMVHASHRFVRFNNQQIPQKALAHITPAAALQKWKVSHQNLFKKNFINRPGPDSYVVRNN